MPTIPVRHALSLLATIALLFFPAAGLRAETLKDIRKIAVSGDASVPASLIKTAERQLKQAVRGTRRPVSLERVTMEVTLSDVTKGRGAAEGRNSATVSVDLVDARGVAVDSDRFAVNSFMPAAKGQDRALAQAIAQRLAIAYHLAAPKPVADWGKRPGKGRKSAEGSQRRVRHQTAAAHATTAEPVIIPTAAALTVRSRTRTTGGTAEKAATAKQPCVVTLTASCN
ncbi:hypothetical protein LXM94_07180 [Rhizobium sp. TRM95111]|uniref:hypothetical protein n=1 Tax=Rhizobium alarense TaxID=2846851 RepID=UPI001F16D8D0|nr:hypothetical protein [Rhizobium alarense]MCF3639751.1 hypothetical protein [Rhizobium alarense]